MNGVRNIVRPDEMTIPANDYGVDIVGHLEEVQSMIDEYNAYHGEHRPYGEENQYLRKEVKVFCIIKALPWRAPYAIYKGDYFREVVLTEVPDAWAYQGDLGVCYDTIPLTDVRVTDRTIEEVMRQVKQLVRQEQQEQRRKIEIANRELAQHREMARRRRGDPRRSEPVPRSPLAGDSVTRSSKSGNVLTSVSGSNNPTSEHEPTPETSYNSEYAREEY